MSFVFEIIFTESILYSVCKYFLKVFLFSTANRDGNRVLYSGQDRTDRRSGEKLRPGLRCLAVIFSRYVIESTSLLLSCVYEIQRTFR